MTPDHPEDHVIDLLPSYRAGSIANEDAARVRVHLAGCAECRAGLAAWSAIGEGFQALESARPLPSPDLLAGVFAAIDARDAGAVASPAHGWVTAFFLPRRIWLGVGSAAALAGVLACAARSAAAGGHLLSYAIPLIAAIAVAATSRPPGSTTQTGRGRRALLARFGVSLSYLLVLALAASTALVVLRGGEVGLLALGWLGPTLLLAAASLLGSRLIRPAVGATGACGLCFLHALMALAGLDSGASALGTVLRGLWATNPLALVISATLVLGAVAGPRPNRSR